MSSTVEIRQMEKSSASLPWSLWLRQTAAIIRLEMKKNLLGRRALLIYLLALVPVLLFASVSFFPQAARSLSNPVKASNIFAGIFEVLILRAIIFFGCAWIFMNLFRGEVVDRSLHYYFLSPVRREVLVVGKYVSGLIASIVLFVGATALSLFFLYLPRGYDASMQHLLDGPGLNYALRYFGIVALACMGYGSFFLAIGLMFRNPIIPALFIYGWEFINFLLPPLLKKISVIHYLQSLTPVPMSEGPFALVSEPTPAWISVPGLLLVTAIVLLFASVQIRRMEIKYGGE
jgi:ABC-type transport system involved in multi-copper enzyme maturation permease subunit